MKILPEIHTLLPPFTHLGFRRRRRRFFVPAATMVQREAQALAPHQAWVLSRRWHRLLPAEARIVPTDVSFH
uniref:Uncharacterized protein n=1 Tax=Oryza meridionalis TaxID=40149 RepID=A0A0E0CSK8_9ORYZ